MKTDSTDINLAFLNEKQMSLSIPLSFINSIEESNVMIGKEMLNYYNQINHLLKYKKKDRRRQHNNKEGIVEIEVNKDICLKWCRRNGVQISNEVQEKFVWKRNVDHSVL